MALLWERLWSLSGSRVFPVRKPFQAIGLNCSQWNVDDIIYFILNMELNGLRIIICLGKSEVCVQRISVFNVIENL